MAVKGGERSGVVLEVGAGEGETGRLIDGVVVALDARGEAVELMVEQGGFDGPGAAELPLGGAAAICSMQSISTSLPGL